MNGIAEWLWEGLTLYEILFELDNTTVVWYCKTVKVIAGNNR
jgi:hypothetical protein